MTIEAQLDILRRGTTEIISEADLAEKLKLGRPLRVKLGVDPTARDVTLGWAVVLRKVRDFQRLGHTGCIIIGDFTAMIGDPSGKSKTRKQLSREEVQANVEAVKDQLFKILIPERTEIFYNADWLGKMSFEDVIRLCSRYTVARILERDDFTNRLREQKPVAMHEILYPLCQGMDSVEIQADIELGGNDQKFNNLVGRNLMEQYGMPAQVVMLCPLLVGTDGKEKMSQSLGNYVSIVDTPNDVYGKTMSIPDDLIANWFELCTDVDMAEASAWIAANPYEAKKRLARELVHMYHGPQEAHAAEEHFKRVFSERQKPVDAPKAEVPRELVAEGIVSLPHLIAALGLAKSNGEARRLIEAGAVSLGEDKITDPRWTAPLEALLGKVLRVGKLQYRTLA